MSAPRPLNPPLCRRCQHPKHSHRKIGGCVTITVTGPPPTPGTITSENPHGDRTQIHCQCPGFLE